MRSIELFSLYVKGPFTQAIFVAATQRNFCRAEVATSSVNHSATSARFSAIYRRDTARFEMQPMKYGNFEQQIDNYACIHALFTKKTSSFISTRPFSLLVSISLVCFYTSNSENIPVNKHEILRKTLLLLLSVLCNANTVPSTRRRRRHETNVVLSVLAITIQTQTEIMRHKTSRGDPCGDSTL